MMNNSNINELHFNNQETSLVSNEKMISSPLSEETCCTNEPERVWIHFGHIPHVSNSLQPTSLEQMKSTLRQPKVMIEKQRKTERLLQDRTTGKLFYQSTETHSKSLKQPLFIPSQFNDSERKPPSIKEERRRAKERNQKALLESIRNQPISFSTSYSSVRRVLNFDDEE